ncbi:PhnD/SsuA/transferrin family substrate-binding protein [uncultured Roseovarius sp.]|uniref:substrate-binding domain-containing protein n=1 Tax=uncultured Roseovarius sp. TaxID=293344 RepID=UPI00260BA49C|nr:PhnD/SsuA/transferrin family substrate-binding protein [uncultured Roseovarius sp.]
MTGITRRKAIMMGGVALAALPMRSVAQTPFRLGLTPVFLDNDAVIIDRLRQALAGAMGREIELVQRRTYEEVTGLLLERSLDAAWLCGYPYLQHRDALDLVAVPVWRGKPLYQSYLIVGARAEAASLADLRGATHAFSDPDSNSGYLVTASDLIAMGARPEQWFSRAIFTYGHRNVVRAVADGLVQSGSVDGYVWEALAKVEPDLTARTRVIGKSEWLGFPPVCARKDIADAEPVQALRGALMGLSRSEPGRAALAALQLDGFQEAPKGIFDGIAARMRLLDT